MLGDSPITEAPLDGSALERATEAHTDCFLNKNLKAEEIKFHSPDAKSKAYSGINGRIIVGSMIIYFLTYSVTLLLTLVVIPSHPHAS